MSDTENKLKKLFDYQSFENSAALKKIIESTESRYGTELDDDELSAVAAAGAVKDPAKKIMGNVNDED